ncbi:hypothetical protein QFZ75_004995 [Streptomyces sp. V3I8]|nr:hypothetical protein [Streptomyces sp. V3I8]
MPAEFRSGKVYAGRVGRGAGCVTPGTAVETHASSAAGLALGGVAPLARNAEGIGVSLGDGGFAGGSGRPVPGELGAGGRWDARTEGAQAVFEVGARVAAGDLPVGRRRGRAGGDRVPGGEEFCTPGSFVVRAGGRSGVGVPSQAVTAIGPPCADDVHRKDRVRGVEDVGPYRLADVPAVGSGQGYVAEQFVPLGDLVAGLAGGGPDRAGVEAADVGEDGGGFARVQGGLLHSVRFVEGGEQGGHVLLGARHAGGLGRRASAGYATQVPAAMVGWAFVGDPGTPVSSPGGGRAG